MKQLLLLPFLFITVISFGQSTWYNNFYNSAVDYFFPINHVELENGKTVIQTNWDNASYGASAYSKLIGADGTELLSIDSDVWAPFKGAIANSLYSDYSGHIYKLNQNFDTIQSNFFPDGIQLFKTGGNSLITLKGSYYACILDTNLNQIWEYDMGQSLPAPYQENSMQYEPVQWARWANYDQATNEVTFTYLYQYADWNANCYYADSSIIDVFKFDKDSGVLLDSARISFDFAIDVVSSIPIVKYSNQRILEILVLPSCDDPSAIYSYSTIRIDANNNYTITNNNEDKPRVYFLGLNNELKMFFYPGSSLSGNNFGGDTIYTLDNSLNITNSYRLDLENDYEIRH